MWWVKRVSGGAILRDVMSGEPGTSLEADLGRAGARPYRLSSCVLRFPAKPGCSRHRRKKCTRFFRPGRLKIGIPPREKHPPNCVAIYPASELVYRVAPIAPDTDTIRRQRLRGGRGTTVSPRSTI